MGFWDVADTTANVTQAGADRIARSIKTDIKNLNTAISKLDQALDEYTQAMQELKTLKDSLSTIWIGQAADTYFMVLQKEIHETGELMNVLASLRTLAVKRRNKLEERRIWATEIANAADSVGNVTSIFN